MTLVFQKLETQQVDKKNTDTKLFGSGSSKRLESAVGSLFELTNII
jgi:hypothetical protein